MIDGSTWISFEAGDNEVDFSADEHASDLAVRLSMIRKFDGV
jgi:hypothetical protein